MTIQKAEAFRKIVTNSNDQIKEAFVKGLDKMSAEDKAAWFKKIAADINPEAKAALKDKTNPPADEFISK